MLSDDIIRFLHSANTRDFRDLQKSVIVMQIACFSPLFYVCFLSLLYFMFSFVLSRFVTILILSRYSIAIQSLVSQPGFARSVVIALAICSHAEAETNENKIYMETINLKLI